MRFKLPTIPFRIKVILCCLPIFLLIYGVIFLSLFTPNLLGEKQECEVCYKSGVTQSTNPIQSDITEGEIINEDCYDNVMSYNSAYQETKQSILSATSVENLQDSFNYSVLSNAFNKITTSCGDFKPFHPEDLEKLKNERYLELAQKQFHVYIVEIEKQVETDISTINSYPTIWDYFTTVFGIDYKSYGFEDSSDPFISTTLHETACFLTTSSNKPCNFYLVTNKIEINTDAIYETESEKIIVNDQGNERMPYLLDHNYCENDSDCVISSSDCSIGSSNTYYHLYDDTTYEGEFNTCSEISSDECALDITFGGLKCIENECVATDPEYYCNTTILEGSAPTEEEQEEILQYEKSCPVQTLIFEAETEDFNVTYVECSEDPRYKDIPEGEDVTVEIYTADFEAGKQEFRNWLAENGLVESEKLRVEYVEKP